MEEDPFGSLIELCQPTSSQEEILRDCPFARESEVFPEDQSSTESESEVTEIVMVSLPETPNDENTPQDEDNFHTPPEQHPHSPISSYEDFKPPTTTAVDHQDADRINCGEGIGTAAVDEGCTDAKRTFDLSKNSDIVVFEGPTMAVDAVEVGEKEIGVSQGKSDEPASKRLKVSEEILDGTPTVCENEPARVESVSNKNGGTEVTELEFDSICEGLGEWLSTVYEGMVVKEAEESVQIGEARLVGKDVYDVEKSGGVDLCGKEKGLANKNIEDLDKFKYVASGGVDHSGKEKGVGVRRELPPSMRVHEKNVGVGSGSGGCPPRNKLWKDLLDALHLVAEELVDSAEDMDFLEIAKRRGLTFPRPNWWPPEGYD